MRTCKKEISGWGRIARGESFLMRPERIDDIKNQGVPFSARGLGRSYGDASLNTKNHLFLMERLNRFLEFNPKTCLLRAESGVTIRDIVETFVPKGFFVPVTPGTKEVTLGGCLAADVHGKNHHCDGSFSDHVSEFELYTAGGILKKVQKNDELFNATAGGLGLTGIITEITLKLLPINSNFIKTTHTPYRCLDALLSHLSEKSPRYSVAWVDLMSRKEIRSIVIEGDHLQEPSPIKAITYPKQFHIPFQAPSWALNSFSQKLFNTLYFHKLSLKKKPFISSLESFFYPLDCIGNWNLLYGKRGLYQYQFVVPVKGSSLFFIKLFNYLQKKRCPVFLAVLKKFGPENSNYLSFPKEGFTLAMDIPGNTPDLFAILDALDEMVLENEGRVYLAKDFHLKPSLFRGMYPRYPLFQKVKKRVDPEFLVQTDLSRRLGIT